MTMLLTSFCGICLEALGVTIIICRCCSWLLAVPIISHVISSGRSLVSRCCASPLSDAISISSVIYLIGICRVFSPAVPCRSLVATERPPCGYTQPQ